MNGNTIVALSTSLAGAIRALLRLSGPEAHEIARRAGSRLGGVRVDRLFLPAPATYTREPMVEIRMPANPSLVEQALEELVAAGARPARPGEFTLRAFLNGRVDLTRAEAVLTMIHARDDAERRASLTGLEGGLARRVSDLESRLLDLSAEVEAAIDFVDEDIQILSQEALEKGVAGILEEVRSIRRESRVQIRSGDEIRILLFGARSVGKSTLFNRLVPGADAIVSETPGTTRDLIEGRMPLEGIGVPVILIDSAGVLEQAGGLEAEAVRRTREAVKSADLVLHVLDATNPAGSHALEPHLSGIRRLSVINKVDAAAPEEEGVPVSARNGLGLEALRERIVRELRGIWSGGAARFCLSLRQSAALQGAEYMLSQALEGARAGREIELIAMDLKDAARELGSLSGRDVDDEVLSRIFSRFCIGK